MKPTGCILGQRLVAALSGHGIDYDTLASIVYGELRTIEREQRKGDWIELPTGSTYSLEWQPEPLETRSCEGT